MRDALVELGRASAIPSPPMARRILSRGRPPRSGDPVIVDLPLPGVRGEVMLLQRLGGATAAMIAITGQPKAAIDSALGRLLGIARLASRPPRRPSRPCSELRSFPYRSSNIRHRP